MSRKIQSNVGFAGLTPRDALAGGATDTVSKGSRRTARNKKKAVGGSSMYSQSVIGTKSIKRLDTLSKKESVNLELTGKTKNFQR